MRPTITLSPKQLGVAIASVAGGGAVGTLLRDLAMKIERNVPVSSPHATWQGQIPWALLALNFLGVMVATSLLRRPLRHHDPNDPLRLLIITGFFGGLTSYSSLFAALAAIWHLSVPASLFVALAAILSGVVAAWIGLKLRFRR